MSDPRLGLPSGSSALEDSLCKGRFHAQKAWAALSGETDVQDNDIEPDVTTELDADAEAGKRVHLIYSGEPCPAATHAEHERAQTALSIDLKKRNEWLNSFPPEEEYDPIESLREYRWWLKNPDTGEKIYSGQTDAVWFRGKKGGPCHILVADLKGLWGSHDPAKSNRQIRRYIALIASCIQEVGYTEVLSAAAYLNQPAVNKDPEMVLYTAEHIFEAVLEMQMEIPEILDPNAPRSVGPVQCGRCRGKMICEEWLEHTKNIPVVPANVDPIPAKEQIATRVEMMTDDDLQRALPWRPALANFLDMLEAEAKRRLRKDPNCMPLFYLKPNPNRSKVSDAKKVFTRLNSEFGVSGDEFCEISSVTKEGCEGLIRKHSPLVGKALEAKLKDLFDGATTPIPVAASLKMKG